jgi:hypothetical protein
MSTRSFLTSGVVLCLAAASLASAPDSRADDTKSVCASSYESAQVLSRKAELLAARDAMRACARESCPSFIKNDCLQWLDNLEKNIPSIVLSAQADGKDVHQVAVQMDGQPLTEGLDGRSIDVNPGRHTFTFRYHLEPGKEVETVTVLVVVEGQKNRAVQAAYQSPPPPPDVIRRPVPAVDYLLLGVGVAALGSFATFAALGMAKKSDLATSGKDACEPFCSNSAVQPVKTDFLIGDISLAAGVVSLGTAAVLLLTRPTLVIHPDGRTESAGNAKLQPIVGVDVGAGVRAIRLGARF